MLAVDPPAVTATALAPSHHGRDDTTPSKTGAHRCATPSPPRNCAQARTATSIEARNRPAQGAGPGRRVPRLLVWSGVTLLVALAALGVLLPAGTALGAMADQRGQWAAQEQVTSENATQQELAERWNYYYQSTRVSPAELKAWLQADATQGKLAERWTYYYHATRMSPADLKAWLQAQQRSRNVTPPAAQAPAPAPHAQPTGQPGWLVVALGMLAAALAVVAGLAVVAARRANRRAQGRASDLTAVMVTLDGAAAPTGSPITLPATSWSPTLPAAAAIASVRWFGRER